MKNKIKGKAGIDYCKCCKGKELYDTQDWESEGQRFITVCHECGAIQQDFKKGGSDTSGKINILKLAAAVLLLLASWIVPR